MTIAGLLSTLNETSFAKDVVKANERKGQIKTVLSEANCELYSPTFLGETGRIVVVKKLHEPDGHEAEAFSREELAKIKEDGQKNVRECDPCLTIVASSDGHQQFIDYGGNPTASASGGMIFYSHQHKTLTGFRALAATMKGNELYCYDVDSKTIRQLVVPEEGYIGESAISPSGKLLAYALCDATNGDYGGQVGIGIYDLEKQSCKVLMPPVKHHGLFDNIEEMFWSGDDLITRVYEAKEFIHVENIDIPRGYLASIVIPTINLEPIWKAPGISDYAYYNIEPAEGNNIGLYYDKTRALISRTGQLIKEKTYPFYPSEFGTLCPDRSLRIAVLRRSNIIIRSVKTGKKVSLRISGKAITACSFGKIDGRPYLAVIATIFKQKNGQDVFDRDELLLLPVPQSVIP